MPATVPACCGSKCRSRLIFGKARDKRDRVHDESDGNDADPALRNPGWSYSRPGIAFLRCFYHDEEFPCVCFVFQHLLAGAKCAQPALGIQVLLMAVSRTPVLRRLYSRDGGLRDSSGSAQEPGCLS